MAAVAVNVANDNNDDNDDPSFAPCPPSLAAALFSASFYTALSCVTPASSRCHCFAVIFAALATQASLLHYRCVGIVGGANNARVVALP
jgi:hypothetical protein